MEGDVYKMKVSISGIHHVCLKCTSLEQFEKTVQFYQDILGLDVIKRWGTEKESGIMLDSGSGLIEIFANAEHELQQGAIRHFALAAEDVDACVAAVRENGYKITVLPKTITPTWKAGSSAKIAFCIGPVGEEIEFFQE